MEIGVVFVFIVDRHCESSCSTAYALLRCRSTIKGKNEAKIRTMIVLLGVSISLLTRPHY